MQEGMFWYWDVCKHHHGMTLSNIAIGTLTNKESSKEVVGWDEGQWTQASVFPKAVANAR
jgi:hypothetical protein